MELEETSVLRQTKAADFELSANRLMLDLAQVGSIIPAELLDYPVAFTGGTFQGGAIQNTDLAPAIPNNSGSLQHTCRQRHLA